MVLFLCFVCLLHFLSVSLTPRFVSLDLFISLDFPAPNSSLLFTVSFTFYVSSQCFVHLLCSDWTFCSLNFSSSDILSFSSVTFSSLLRKEKKLLSVTLFAVIDKQCQSSQPQAFLTSSSKRKTKARKRALSSPILQFVDFFFFLSEVLVCSVLLFYCFFDPIEFKEARLKIKGKKLTAE